MGHSIGRNLPATGFGTRRACALALMTVLSAASAAGFAATYTVTNAQNSGAGSLRQAMLDANASGDVITVGNFPLVKAKRANTSRG